VTFTPPTIDWGALAPALTLSVAAIVVLLVGLFAASRSLLAGLSLVGIVVALVVTIGGARAGAVSVNEMLVLDGFAAFFGVIVLVVAAISLFLAGDYVDRNAISLGEFYALLLFCCSGMLLVVGAADLIMLLVGIEVLSIALYVLSGFTRGRAASEEAAMKYFLLGAFSLSFMIFGSALLFGIARSTRLATIAAALAPSAGVSLLSNPLLLAGLALVLVGFAFKLSLVPFHMWTPDAYEGAPTPITAFMSVATKAAIFAALLRFLAFAVPSLRPEWTAVLWALAVLTMIVGNVAAVAQSRVKRMLAYSSIAQAGYILVGVIAGEEFGGPAVMFYLLAYAFMNVGAFAVLMAFGEPGDADPTVSDLNGLASRQPLLAIAMTVFMLSLAGIPLTAGFIGKLYVFTAGVRAGQLLLVVVGVLTSAVATFYYLRIVVAMYMRPADAAPGAPPIRMTGLLSALLVILMVATVALGVLPAGPLGFAAAAAAVR
jgi:NADH-quinone oxidoreductase subunit N